MQSLSLQHKRQNRSPSVLAPPPFISVIVPVRNEAAFIADTLQQLLNQHYDSARFEVIVADGRSTDDTRALVTALQTRNANLHLLDNPRHLSSAGRNLAVRAAQGDILLLIDGHCQLNNPYYLQSIADALEESSADCIGRPQPLDVTEANLVQRAIAAARASRLGHHPGSHIYSDRAGYVPPQSVAVAYRRSVFETVGLFDERFDACEDVEFNHRVAKAGLTCWFTPRVRVQYHPRATIGGLFRQMVRYGRGRVRLFRKHPETFSLSGMLPAAFLAGVVVGPFLAWWSSLLALLYVSVLGIYGAILLSFSIWLCVCKKNAKLFPLFPLVFLTIHAGAGVGIWCELALGSPRLASIDSPKELSRTS